jgi:hypothetical protein
MAEGSEAKPEVSLAAKTPHAPPLHAGYAC